MEARRKGRVIIIIVVPWATVKGLERPQKIQIEDKIQDIY
jgi:hypothetical protein